MHEMSIAIELMRQLEMLAAEHHFERIDEFTVSVGEMRQVVPEALKLSFEIVSEGSPAAGAALTLKVVRLAARCRCCGSRFEPRIDAFSCAKCNQADVEIVQGNEMVLTSVTGRQQERPASDED